MADIAWPSGIRMPLEVEFGLFSPGLVFTSPMNGAQRTLGMPGARWVQRIRWNNVAELDSRVIEAMLLKLRGLENRLVAHRLARPGLSGVGGGTPVVNGANQTGNTINVSGLPLNLAGWARNGDMVGIGGELKQLTADVNSNGSGQAVLTFEPFLRASPADGSLIQTVRPTARWMLQDPLVKWTELRARLVAGHAIDLAETFV